MSVKDASDFFKDNKKIKKTLEAMLTVGLPYLSLGQPLNTLSGGERQRVKLAKELHGKGNIYILDVAKLMKLFNSLVDKGNTVIIIEHNLDVIKMADYIIDIGPDGGSKGGEVVFTGTPLEMIESSNTITAQYLRKASGN